MSTTVTPGQQAPAKKAPPVKKPKHAKYRYEAENGQGEQVKGVAEGPSANHVRNDLAVQGLRVTKITEKKGLQVEIKAEKVPLVDIMHFSWQMATFLRAGVPMTEALDNLRQDAANKRFQAVLADVLDRVMGGRSVTESLKLRRHFPSYFMALLGSAEAIRN